MDNYDWETAIACTAMAACVAILLGVVLLFATYFSGQYHYEYQCTDNVVENHLYIWGDVPIGGWESIDGDPVGACK